MTLIDDRLMRSHIWVSEVMLDRASTLAQLTTIKANQSKAKQIIDRFSYVARYYCFKSIA